MFLRVFLIGKNGMIKFFQPWCSQCTRMKPDWDRLSEEAHPSVFIADVNCEYEHDFCQNEGIEGFPTIRVYKDGSVDTYDGGRGFDALRSFVDTNLAQKCDIANVVGSCSPKATKYVSKWKSKDFDSIKNELIRLEIMVDKTMTADLKVWLRERIFILKQLVAKDEL